MRPLEAFDAKLATMAGLARTGDGGAYWFDRINRAEAADLLDPDEQPKRLAASCMRALRLATPFAVQTEMVDLLEVATLDLPSYELARSDIAEPIGFAWLERSLHDDGAERPPQIDGLVWADYHALVSGASEIMDDYVFGPNYEGNDGGIHTFVISRISGIPVPTAWGYWPYGETWQAFDDQRDAIALAAFLRLIQERVVVQRTERMPRGARRRADRASAPGDIIRVVSLRAAQRWPSADSDGDPTAVQWSCRWLVRGHWRQQWYPSEQRHAPKWIAPYVKGPDDRPLHLPDHVFDVNR